MQLTIVRGANVNCFRPAITRDLLHPAVVRLLYGARAIASREEAHVVRRKIILSKNSEVAGFLPPSCDDVCYSSLRHFSSLADIRASYARENVNPVQIFFCTERALDQLYVAPDINSKPLKYKGFDVQSSYEYCGITEYFVLASKYFVPMNPDTDWYCQYV